MNKRLLLFVAIGALVLLGLALVIYFISGQTNQTQNASSKDAQSVVDAYLRKHANPVLYRGIQVQFSEPIDDRYMAFVVGAPIEGRADEGNLDHIGIIDTSLAPEDAIIFGPAYNYSPEDLNAMPKVVRKYVVKWLGGESYANKF